MLEGMDDGTERALQLAGLLSTLFKIKGVVLIVTDDLAFHSYANTLSENPEVDLAAFAGTLAPRAILEIMRGQLFAYARGSLRHWTVTGIPVRFHDDTVIANRELCRDFTTDHGVVKLVPVEEITADCILAAVYPEPDADAQARAYQLLINGLTDAFDMNWATLHTLCHRPEYRVGEELAQMRLAAKREIDAMGAAGDHVGETPATLLEEAPPLEEDVLLSLPSASEEALDVTAINGNGDGISNALPGN